MLLAVVGYYYNPSNNSHKKQERLWFKRFKTDNLSNTLVDEIYYLPILVFNSRSSLFVLKILGEFIWNHDKFVLKLT